MANRKVYDVQVTVRRVTLPDPEAEEAWYRSMAMMFKLQDRLEAREAVSGPAEAQKAGIEMKGVAP